MRIELRHWRDVRPDAYAAPGSGHVEPAARCGEEVEANMTDELFLAHSENDAGKAHRLRDHLLDMQKMILTYATTETQKPFLKLAALLHDFGKGSSCVSRCVF